GELLHVADRIGSSRGVDVRDVVGHRLELAGFFTFLGEELVADALLDVVSLAGEQQERLVLGLPAEARDRSVVAVAIRVTGRQEALDPAQDTERALRRGVGRLVRHDGGVGNRFDQPQTERRCGNAEDHVVPGDLSVKVFLVDRAGRSVARLVDPATDDKQRVDAAVAGAIRLELEARFTHGPIALDEGWHEILRAERRRHPDLRIHGRAGAAGHGLSVAAGAAVEVETRTEAVTDALDFDEGITARVEKGLLPGGERREIFAGASGTVANTGIASIEELSLSRTREEDRETDHEE